jgi:hypothetical protein
MVNSDLLKVANCTSREMEEYGFHTLSVTQKGKCFYAFISSVLWKWIKMFSVATDYSWLLLCFLRQYNTSEVLSKNVLQTGLMTKQYTQRQRLHTDTYF